MTTAWRADPQPASSLLDRLINREDSALTPILPAAQSPALGPKVTRRQRAKQLATLRVQIERDLLALLGTRQMSADTNLQAWPLAASSVLNYGIPDLSAMTASSMDVRWLQKTLTQTIRRFEPRLHPETLQVSCHVNANACHDVRVEIEALFGPADALESFAMGISICLSSGRCQSLSPSRAA
ncbi:MAG: type VI secretion system baseplate subunit TssE [Pirellulales bacterium]|nr:type VI secretion system baseplate subunit TssE [Pirellulales bacterium]